MQIGISFACDELWVSWKLKLYFWIAAAIRALSPADIRGTLVLPSLSWVTGSTWPSPAIGNPRLMALTNLDFDSLCGANDLEGRTKNSPRDIQMVQSSPVQVI